MQGCKDNLQGNVKAYDITRIHILQLPIERRHLCDSFFMNRSKILSEIIIDDVNDSVLLKNQFRSASNVFSQNNFPGSQCYKTFFDEI